LGHHPEAQISAKSAAVIVQRDLGCTIVITDAVDNNASEAAYGPVVTALTLLATVVVAGVAPVAVDPAPADPAALAPLSPPPPPQAPSAPRQHNVVAKRCNAPNSIFFIFIS
jgi:hypothetical protein